MITLGPDGVKSENSLIRYLSLLLSREYPVESKKQQLQNEYNIEMDQELEKEMTTVCNLGEGIARKSRDEGLAQGVAQGMNKVTQLMAKLCSLKKYQDVEKASTDPEYLQKLLEEYRLVEA